MKLHLTGYKTIAASNAVRVPIMPTPPNFHKLIGRVLLDSTDKEFDKLVEQLWNFYNQAKGEYPAIYFWIENN